MTAATRGGRVELGLGGDAGANAYALLTSLIVPRPIAWISTRSRDGVDNLAPHSFVTVASARPPVVLFTSLGRKDTLRNIEQTGEFVINVAPADRAATVNATATEHPPEVSEFDAAAVPREPSRTVAPPRVADAPAALECRLRHVVAIDPAVVVFGDVLHVAVAAELVDGAGAVSLRGRPPIARLGGDEWAELGRVTAIPRIPYAPDGDGPRA